MDALDRERGDGDTTASMIKDTIKRRLPQFSERYHGPRTFQSAARGGVDRGLVQAEADDKSAITVVTAERESERPRELIDDDDIPF